jgi:hypothetical protein
MMNGDEIIDIELIEQKDDILDIDAENYEIPEDIEHPFIIEDNPLNIDLKWCNLTPRLKSIFAKPYFKPLSPEWFEQRMNGLSASEIGAALGHAKRYPNDNYDPDEKVFLQKTNQIPPEPDNENFIHGREKEPIARQLYSLKKRVITLHCGLIQDEDIPWLFVTPDLIALDWTKFKNGQITLSKQHLMSRDLSRFNGKNNLSSLIFRKTKSRFERYQSETWRNQITKQKKDYSRNGRKNDARNTSRIL